MGARTLLRLAVYKSWPIYGLSYRWCRVLALSSLVRLVLNNGIHQPNKAGQVGILGVPKSDHRILPSEVLFLRDMVVKD